MPTKERCRDCEKWIKRASNRTHRCLDCRHKHENPTSAPPPDTFLPTTDKIIRNVTNLMSKLPVHSHHRAPLVKHLSEGLSSTEAAAILHTSASTVRGVKRKSYDDADLFNDKYKRNVKRQKLHPGVLTELVQYFQSTCPVPSGSKHETMKQYINDDLLYEGYKATVAHPVHFNTFLKYKRQMRIVRVTSYFDAHAAQIKKSIHKSYQISEFQRVHDLEQASWGPSTVEDVAAILETDCPTAEIHLFKEIDRDNEKKPDVLGVPLIKACHCFQYQDGKCWQSRQTGSETKREFAFQKNKPIEGA